MATGRADPGVAVIPIGCGPVGEFSMSIVGGRPSGHRDVSMAVGEDRGPSILAVTSELPWPLNTGGHLRTFHLLRALARTFRVRLVSAVSPGEEPCVEALAQTGI